MDVPELMNESGNLKKTGNVGVADHRAGPRMRHSCIGTGHKRDQKYTRQIGRQARGKLVFCVFQDHFKVFQVVKGHSVGGVGVLVACQAIESVIVAFLQIPILLFGGIQQLLSLFFVGYNVECDGCRRFRRMCLAHGGNLSGVSFLSSF